MASAAWRLVATLLLILSVSACGGGSTTAPAQTTDDHPKGFPLTIEHKYGTIRLEWPALRVVSVGWNDADIAQALGTKPVGVRTLLPEYPTYPWVDPVVGGPIPIVGRQELDFDAIAAAKPDVILATGADIDQPTYDQLSKIAPTVAQPQRFDGAQTPWYNQTYIIGQVLGKADAARQLSQEVGSNFNLARSTHQNWVGVVAAVDWLPDGGGHYLVPFKDIRRSVFDMLGMLTQRYSGPTAEQDLKAKADMGLLAVVGATEQQVAGMPALAKLQAVFERRAVYVPAGSPLAAAMTLSGPRAQMYALKELEPQLVAALKPAPKP